jgi:hypothetical protein
MITIKEIERICDGTHTGTDIVKAIIEIGNESTDATKAYYGGGVIMIGGNIPKTLVWPTKENMFEFHKQDLVTKEWHPDPRILKLGIFVDSCGGFELMQQVFYAVKKEYHGSMRSLEYAWKGIGGWSS